LRNFSECEKCFGGKIQKKFSKFWQKSGKKLREIYHKKNPKNPNIYAFSRNALPTTVQTVLYVLPCFLMAFVFVLLGEKAFCSFDNPHRVDFGKDWYAEVPIPQLIVAMRVSLFLKNSFLIKFFQDNTFGYLYMIIFFVSTIFCYMLAILFAWRTVVGLKAQSRHMSPKTLAMQKQIGQALLAQVCFLFLMSTIFALYCIEMFTYKFCNSNRQKLVFGVVNMRSREFVNKNIELVF
jgi:hypothetical protein